MASQRHDSIVQEVQSKHEAYLALELSHSSDIFETRSSCCGTSSSPPSSGTSVSDTALQASASTATPRRQTKAEVEFSRIKNACPVLRSTGCTEQFCQAGRMIKTDEPRVGQDRPSTKIREEALDFLRQLHSDGVIETEAALGGRTEEVLQQLQETSEFKDRLTHGAKELDDDGRTIHAESQMLAGGMWHQSREELEHGLRLAWKNASKCIMRSESYSLQLYDLRHITSSRDMGSAIIENMKKAFNGGDIKPAVFVFPPRQVGQRGPMIWNGQVLSFAGYEDDDGVILGDPANVALTKAIVELGWKPPQMRTQWDLLPLVTMAEGDDPHLTPISEHDFPLVRIKHPTHQLAFEKLGLRWVPAPALSRLGFDIGGVQYTASPFIGWFMDAEIGVRDLADTQRYNMLPKIVVALGWAESETALERAPEHEKLALLSKAQAELNYAVHHSYKEAGVMISDSFTASTMYCNFDDEHFQDKGFRLPSNPYWLAPPQGSIVPLWHRGGAPNYQPTPLICKHVQNPINAWRRKVGQRQEVPRAASDGQSEVSSSRHVSAADEGEQATLHRGESDGTVHIHICYCSAATTARKLADELYRELAAAAPARYHIKPVTTLNQLDPWKVGKEDVVLVVASTTGHGEVPANGAKLMKSLEASSDGVDFGYMIFGNGSSIYHETFNAAARSIHHALEQKGARPLDGGIFEGDTAVNDPPWDDLERWLRSVRTELGFPTDSGKQSENVSTQRTQTSNFDIVTKMKPARLAGRIAREKNGVSHVVLDILDSRYELLSHVSIMLPNDKGDVNRALKALRLTGNEQASDGTRITTRTFLTDFVDLEKPFRQMDWASDLDLRESAQQLIARLPLTKALKAMSRILRSTVSLEQVFAAMPLKTPRTYSSAGSQAYLQSCGRGNQLELLVQSRHQGLCAKFFQSALVGSSLRIRFHKSKWSALLQETRRPFICFATGSGLAPIRSLLQHRLHLTQTSDDDVGSVTLILGFHKTDATTLLNAIRESLDAGVVDICLLTPSNPDKFRAQDRIFETGIRDVIVRKLRREGASVLVCASEAAAKGFEQNLRGLIGCDVRAALGEHYVEEVFLHRADHPRR